MNPVRLSLSADCFALPILATVIASVLRHTEDRPVHALIYTRSDAYQGFTAGRLTVEFQRPSVLFDTRPGRLPAAMFDRFSVLQDRPDWDRVLMLDWDQLVIGSLLKYYDRPMPGVCGAFVHGRNGATFGSTLKHYHHAALSIWNKPFFRFPGLFNLAECRTARILPRMMDLAWTLSSEMCLFAEACGHRLEWVDRCWNTMVQVDGMEAGARVLHWFGDRKPWDHDLPGSRIWRDARRSWADLRAGRF